MPHTVAGTAAAARIIGFGVVSNFLSADLAGGSSVTVTTQVDSTYDFQTRYLNGQLWQGQAEGSAIAGTPLYYGTGGLPTQASNTGAPLNLVSVMIQSGNRNWFDAPIPVSLIVGDGIHPFPLPVWETIRAGTTVSVTYYNNTANYELRGGLVFVGAQLRRA